MQLTPSSKRALILALAPLAFGIYYMVAPSTMPLVASDSPGYMYFNADRPIGYPVFLFVVKHLTGRYSSVPDVQIFIFCLATFLLGVVLHTYTKSLVLALTVEVGVLGHPGLLRFANSLMSDSLSGSVLVFFVVTLVHFLAKPSQMRLLLVCVTVALAITLRPVNVALVPVIALIPLMYRSASGLPPRRAIVLIAAITALGLGVTPVANLLIHGSLDSSSPLARGLLQKAIFMDVRDPELESSSPDAILIARAANPVNDYLRTVPADIRDFMRYRYSQVLRFGVILPGLDALHPDLSAGQIDRIMMRYTLWRFEHDPAALVRQILREYWNLIANYTFVTSAQQLRYVAFVRDHPPVMPTPSQNQAPQSEPARRALADVGAEGMAVVDSVFDETSVSEPPTARPYVLIIGLKTAQICSILLSFSLLWPLWLRLRGVPVHGTWVLLGLIALTVQLQLAVTATVEMAQPRYLYPLWPLLWVILILAPYEAVAGWRRRTATC